MCRNDVTVRRYDVNAAVARVLVVPVALTLLLYAQRTHTHTHTHMECTVEYGGLRHRWVGTPMGKEPNP